MIKAPGRVGSALSVGRVKSVWRDRGSYKVRVAKVAKSFRTPEP